jgi:hypothetical protein
MNNGDIVKKLRERGPVPPGCGPRPNSVRSWLRCDARHSLYLGSIKKL